MVTVGKVTIKLRIPIQCFVRNPLIVISKSQFPANSCSRSYVNFWR